MHATKYLVALLALGAAYLGTQSPAVAQSSDTLQEKRCVNLRDIDRTRIVDNSTILFYMKDRMVRINRLPHACPGLDRGRPFSYRVSMDQLCDTDSITVLENRGFGFTEGATCMISTFSPISGDEASDLIKASRRGASK